MADILYKYGMKLIPKGNHSLQFRKPKMEIGTVATDWSPAPEDPDADLLERINVLQTDFQVVQGEIQAKVWETDIEKATDGLYESMNEMYAYIDETINGISAEVGDLTFTVENNYYTLTEQISDLVITTDSITGMVRDVEQNMDTYYSEVSERIAILEITSDSITTTVTNLESELIGDPNAKNLLAYTDEMSVSPEMASSQMYWVVVEDSTAVNGYAAYIRAVNFSANREPYAAVFDMSSLILSVKKSQLVQGEIYTFSFYVRNANGTEPDYATYTKYMSQEIIIGQSNVVYDFSSVTTTQFDDYDAFYRSSTAWSRVSVTFTLSDIDNFAIQLAPIWWSQRDQYSLRVCGLMLNEGSEALDWDDGGIGKYATTSFVQSQVVQLADSITSTVSNLQDNMESQIEQLAGSIKLEVSSKTNGSASIVMTVDGEDAGGDTIYPNGLRSAFANDTTAITISAGTVTFNSNTFIVNSTYFSVTATGVITATSGTIAGWTISSWAIYDGPQYIHDSDTEGVILQSGISGGLRINYNNYSMLLRYGRLSVERNGETTGYISGNTVYTTTGTYGIRLAGLGIIALETPYLMACEEYVAPGDNNAGYVGFTGSVRVMIGENSYHQFFFHNGICSG